jgi:ethanolamine ammonia-lyase small subunit
MTSPRDALRRFTEARVRLGRAGHALPTREVLALRLAHARARDAVRRPWSAPGFAEELGARGIEARVVASAAPDLDAYLLRPELGRSLDARSRGELAALARPAEGWDVALVATSGLSASAIERHGAALVAESLARLAGAGLSVAPVVLVERGRVAIGDEIGHALGARLAAVVVGERPGLSAADGLGIYLTWDPRPGRTDEARNCISNVRPPGGLAYDEAAAKLAWLAREALRRQLSGVALKDESPRLDGGAPAPAVR